MSSQDHLPQPATPRDPITGHRSLATAGNTTGLYLQQYFRSGWAFFIPYLAAYLLYAWLRWPVNPVDGGQWAVVPCLLHVYWALHVVHLVLGAFALRAWWQAGGKGQGAKSEEQLVQPTSSLLSSESVGLLAADRLLSIGYRLLPWLCLALLFYIPEVYLEYPSDPWQHYGRINEWGVMQVVQQHSSWKKFGYFVIYSITGSLKSPSGQLVILNIYQTAAAMVLSWQLFRLGCTIGLGARSSMIFVFAQLFILGNDIFSFHRYYGISTTLIAQIGTFAAMRIVIEALNRKSSDYCEFIRLWAQALFVGALIVVLVIFNHIQSIGMIALGGAALSFAALYTYSRKASAYSFLLFILANVAAFNWFPQNRSIYQTYWLDGWMSDWLGFNIFTAGSPAFESAIRITGVIGLANFLAGLWLLFRNHLVGWLTVLPVVFLCCPIVAIPLASAITTHTAGELTVIYTFHRMLLVIPGGLALVICIGQILNRPKLQQFAVPPIHLGATVFLLSLIVLLPAGSPYYNRLWNSWARTPEDLSATHFTKYSSAFIIKSTASEVQFYANQDFSYMAKAMGGAVLSESQKGYGKHSSFDRLLSLLARSSHSEVLLYVPQRFHLYSPESQAAQLSRHWTPQDMVRVHSGGRELEEWALARSINISKSAIVPAR